MTVGQAHDLQINRVVVDLHDVTVPSDYSSVHADTATASGSIGYDALSRLLGTAGPRRIGRPADRRAVRAHPRSEVHRHGQRRRPRLVRATGSRFDNARVSVNGVNVPPVVAHLLAHVFERSISLAGLPFHVQVTGVDVTPDALVIKLAGRDLTYRR